MWPVGNPRGEPVPESTRTMVAERRRSLKLSHKEMFKKLGVSRTSYWNAMAGHRVSEKTREKFRYWVQNAPKRGDPVDGQV